MCVSVCDGWLLTSVGCCSFSDEQLCLTLLLLTIVVYIYTVIAFNFFRKFYVQAEDDNVDQKCHDMFTVGGRILFKKNSVFAHGLRTTVLMKRLLLNEATHQTSCISLLSFLFVNATGRIQSN